VESECVVPLSRKIEIATETEIERGVMQYSLEPESVLVLRFAFSREEICKSCEIC